MVTVKNCVLFFSSQTRVQSVPGPDEIGNVVEKVVDLIRHINLEVDSDEIKELLVSHNSELIVDELIEMHEQDIEKFESLDPVQSEDRIRVGNLTENLQFH
ncbi:uncharacterized protein TNCV_3032471 [Trichonephila clavipes]|nr:uncharacterized protein TNCV_3032471 [Trichonephila clavipes]